MKFASFRAPRGRVLRRDQLVSCIVVALAATGCAGAPRDPWFDHMVQSGAVEPTNDVEKGALAKMEELPVDAPASVAGGTVVAGAPYVAASGRVCRSLAIEGAGEKLVCKDAASSEDDEAPTWFFVPSVAAGTAP